MCVTIEARTVDQALLAADSLLLRCGAVRKSGGPSNRPGR
ncbi:hypothetical protein [Streptomyces sp. 840.1]|nr:hypothetical protein [Streptomyces sp. 840.1]